MDNVTKWSEILDGEDEEQERVVNDSKGCKEVVMERPFHLNKFRKFRMWLATALFLSLSRSVNPRLSIASSYWW